MVRFDSVSLFALAVFLGASCLSAENTAPATDTSVPKVKTPVAPVFGHIDSRDLGAAGDNKADDGQALSAATRKGQGVTLREGVYKVTSPLMISADPNARASYGTGLYGTGGPNVSAWVGHGGTAFSLSTPGQDAVIEEIGVPGRDLEFSNLGIRGNGDTKCGLWLKDILFSGARLQDLHVSNVQTAFKLGGGTGADGEAVLLDHCFATSVQTGFEDMTLNGQTFCTQINSGQYYMNSGGTFARVGNPNLNHQFSSRDVSVSFNGGLNPENVFFEDKGTQGPMILDGGRCEIKGGTILKYATGTPNQYGHITIENIQFVALTSSPIVLCLPSTRGQYDIEFVNDQFSYMKPPAGQPRYPITLNIGAGDTSRIAFRHCRFINAGENQMTLKTDANFPHKGLVLDDCWRDTATSRSLVPMQ